MYSNPTKRQKLSSNDNRPGSAQIDQQPNNTPTFPAANSNAKDESSRLQQEAIRILMMVVTTNKSNNQAALVQAQIQKLLKLGHTKPDIEEMKSIINALKNSLGIRASVEDEAQLTVKPTDVHPKEVEPQTTQIAQPQACQVASPVTPPSESDQVPVLLPNQDGYFELVQPEPQSQKQEIVYGDIQTQRLQLGIPPLNASIQDQLVRNLRDPHHCMQVITHLLCREESLNYERDINKDEYEDFMPMSKLNAVTAGGRAVAVPQTVVQDSKKPKNIMTSQAVSIDRERLKQLAMDLVKRQQAAQNAQKQFAQADLLAKITSQIARLKQQQVVQNAVANVTSVVHLQPTFQLTVNQIADTQQAPQKEKLRTEIAKKRDEDRLSMSSEEVQEAAPLKESQDQPELQPQVQLPDDDQIQETAKSFQSPIQLPQKRDFEDTISENGNPVEPQSKRSEQHEPQIAMIQPNTVIEKMLKLDAETRERVIMDFDINKREQIFEVAGKVLNKKFIKFHQIDPTWLVSRQSGWHFRELQCAFQQGDVSVNASERNPIQSRQPRSKLTVAARDIESCGLSVQNTLALSCKQEHIPESSDFVVYHFKKSHKKKQFRLYECKCMDIKPSTIAKMHQSRSSLARKSKEQQPCMKVFGSISKFYAHLRIHTQEKPFHCMFEGCSMSFNQRGNLKQHLNLVHPNQVPGSHRQFCNSCNNTLPADEDGKEGNRTVGVRGNQAFGFNYKLEKANEPVTCSCEKPVPAVFKIDKQDKAK